MNIMTRRGSEDNIVTYEHYCDTLADMNNIDPKYITLGSTCVVINGTNNQLEVYIASTDKQWTSLLSTSSGGGSSSSGLVVTFADTGLADKTWQQIYDAMAAGQTVIGIMPYSETFHTYDGAYTAMFCGHTYANDGTANLYPAVVFRDGDSTIFTVSYWGEDNYPGIIHY